MSEKIYPLIEHAYEELHTASGKRLSDITLDAIAEGGITTSDVRISKATLLAQAEIAHNSGYPQLAANLKRAAELTAVPNDELLAMYERIRPGRGTYEQLLELAIRLETVYGAYETGRFVREAADVYRARGLLKKSTT